MWRLWIVAVVVLTASTATADVLELPKGDDAVPLVVVLHGDREHAKAAAARWHAAVKAKGWALLAIECPNDQGCKDSWWKWNGDARFVLDKIAAVTKQRAIGHVYLVGWSGGATYIGWHVQAWPSAISAVVLHGGGAAPDDTTCVTLPAYFLVGDKNPLHNLAKQLRAYFDTCKQDVVWDLVKGADHAGEQRALTRKKARTILDWLATH